jgi:citrate synthase
VRPGLDNVIAAETVLSHVDGEAGRLIIRGHDLEDLAGRITYEDATALLWDGFAPTSDLRAELGSARVRAFERFKPLADQASRLSAVEALRLLLAAVPDGERSKEPVDALAAAGVAAAMAARLTSGHLALTPDPALSHAADILRMLRGRLATPTKSRPLRPTSLPSSITA